jgi:hypothetical protein
MSSMHALAAALADSSNVSHCTALAQSVVALQQHQMLQPDTPVCYLLHFTALQNLQADLQASSFATASTLAVYLFALGLSALLWGPFCDCMGRRPTYIASTIAFVATSVGCAFAPTMWLLLLLRAFQGASSECCVGNAPAACCAMAGRQDSVGVTAWPRHTVCSVQQTSLPVFEEEEEEEEGLHGVFKRLRRNGHQLIKGSCKQFNTDCHSCLFLPAAQAPNDCRMSVYVACATANIFFAACFFQCSWCIHSVRQWRAG